MCSIKKEQLYFFLSRNNFFVWEKSYEGKIVFYLVSETLQITKLNWETVWKREKMGCLFTWETNTQQ